MLSDLDASPMLIASPNMDAKDLLPIVDDPLAEQAPQTIVAPPATSSTVSRGRRTSKKKRKRVGRACIFCQRSHMSCDDSRPCKRCVARGCADQCRDPDGKRKRRGRKRKTPLPDGEEADSSGSSDEDGNEDVDVTAPVPIAGGMNRAKHHHHHHHHSDDLHETFGVSLGDMSQGSRPFFITKAKRAKLKEDFSDDDDDMDGVPHLAGPTSHFGGMHHDHFDEDDQVSAINGAPNGGAGGSGPMAVPRGRSMSGAAGHHDEFSHFNIYPELLTLPSPVSGSHQHAHMWFPSPRNSQFGAHMPFEMGDAHFAASPIISGLAHSFGNSCSSTSYMQHTPNANKGFQDFFPSGSASDNPSFEGFIL